MGQAGVVAGVLPGQGRERKGRRKDQGIARLRRKLGKTSEKLFRLKGAGPAGNSREDVPIFFVVGAPKSGTTWLRRMLDQHPEILCRGEGKFFGRNDRDPNFEKVQVNNTGHLLRPASLYNALAECEPLRIWMERTWWSRDGDVEEHMAHLTREAVCYFLTQKLSKTGKRIVGDKTPFPGADIVQEIGKLLPEAKVIHIIRDGRDQAVSHEHHRWNRVRPVEEGGRLTPEERSKRDRYREDPEKFVASGESIFSEQRILSAAKSWRSNVGNTHRDGPSLLGGGYMEVRYEDLLERPEEEMARLFRFLGASDDEAIVHRVVEKNRFENLTRRRGSERQAGSEDSTSFLRKGVVGDWRSVFTERDKAVYKEIAGDLLVEFGYEKDKSW